MIKIVMNNGTVYMNDPSLGWNLDRVEDIQECLNRAGKYVLETLMVKHINIYKNDVKEIIEE